MGQQVAKLLSPAPCLAASRTRPRDPAREKPCGSNEEGDKYVEDLELRLLLEGVFAVAGYDFRDYLVPMLRRRVWQCVREERLRTISGFLEKVLHDPGCLNRLVQALCINVTALFRRPDFYLALSREVLPQLHTYPFIRIWHAGCATGEEVFSTVILLHEHGLLERCRIYATDINSGALANARAGILALDGLEAANARYHQAGGRRRLSDYCTATGRPAVFDPELRRNIVFAQHNLATDSSFNEFNLIVCRNVLIYFGKPLQDRVHELLYRSLAMFGVLALGSQESLHFSPWQHAYRELSGQQKLYRRIV